MSIFASCIGGEYTMLIGRPPAVITCALFCMASVGGGNFFVSSLLAQGTSRHSFCLKTWQPTLGGGNGNSGLALRGNDAGGPDSSLVYANSLSCAASPLVI